MRILICGSNTAPTNKICRRASSDSEQRPQPTSSSWALYHSAVRILNCGSANTEFRFYYGVATLSRLLKMIGLFCKRAL